MDSFQETVFKLKKYWADRGCVIQEPYDIEVGAGRCLRKPFSGVGAEAVAGGLRAAEPAAGRRALRG
jgi:glycyl-tRNA synthetase alpha subunit